MRTKKQIYKKNIRVTKSFKDNCTKLGIDTSEGIRRVIRQVIDNH